MDWPLQHLGEGISSVGIVTRLQAKCFGVSIPERAKDFPRNVHTVCGVHPAPCSVDTGLKWPGLEIDRSPHASSEVKNEWSYASNPCICLHGIDEANLPAPYSNLVSQTRAVLLCQLHGNPDIACYCTVR